MLLLRLPGSFLLRYADRQFLALLFQEPPRRTRFELQDGTPNASEEVFSSLDEIPMDVNHAHAAEEAIELFFGFPHASQRNHEKLHLNGYRSGSFRLLD